MQIITDNEEKYLLVCLCNCSLQYIFQHFFPIILNDSFNQLTVASCPRGDSAAQDISVKRVSLLNLYPIIPSYTF